jgi:molecular chaperone DnaJ
MRDPYAVLGITRAASADQVRAAYRRLAAALHPDRNPGNAAAARRFKEVSEAYTKINSSPSGGAAAAAAAARPSVQVEEVSPVSAIGDVVGGFVDLLFGTTHATSKTRGPAVCKANVRIDRRAAALGTRREIEVPWDAPCASCAGGGAEPGESCLACNGSGRTGGNLGLVRIVATCRTCLGSGKSTRPCRDCGGAGASPRKERFDIDIPAGVRDGTRLLYRGAGLKDAFGRPLEILVDVAVEV